jgi:hypothetical protein
MLSPFRQLSVCKDDAVRRLGEFRPPGQALEARPLGRQAHPC